MSKHWWQNIGVRVVLLDYSDPMTLELDYSDPVYMLCEVFVGGICP